MLAGLARLQGRSLVIVVRDDAAAVNAAEAYLLTVPPGAATVTDPRRIEQATGEFGAAAVFCSDVSKYFDLDMTVLQQCLEKLRPGACVIARLGGLTEAQASALTNTGLFAGAVGSRLGTKVPTAKGYDVEFSCSKPTWAAGTVASIAGTDLINEDELLGEVPAPEGKGKSDCSSKPKACANCSCGRKELEDTLGAEEAKKKLEQGTQRSSCGSCYLGDAFRCDGCPYRGLPAFKPGTKVELSEADAEGMGQFTGRVDAGDEATTLETGKVVLSVN